MHTTIYTDLGKAVRLRRKALHLTQQQLADLAGCGRLFASQLESGKSSVRLDKVVDVLRTLGLQIRIESGSEGVVIDRLA